MTLPERMSAMPNRGDKIKTTCNVCGDSFTYVDGKSEWEHHTKVCEECSEYFAELYDRKITLLRKHLDETLLEHIVTSVNELDDYAAIPTPSQAHHGKADNYWIIDVTGDMTGVELPSTSSEMQ